MKISIITPTYNSEATLKDTLSSVASQTYKNVEHIIVDGLSSDKTLDIARAFPHVTNIISEKDQGIFDAMNKGILAASGDIVGILNSDDFYANNQVLEEIASSFNTYNVDAVYGNIYFVHPGNLTKVVRNYSSKNFRLWKFAYGYTPPHPTFFTKKSLYEKYGTYDADYKYAADYELMMRFLYTKRVKSHHLDQVIAIMRTGGASNKTLWVKYALNREIVKACKTNGVYTNLILLFSKYFLKISEYISPFFMRLVSREHLNKSSIQKI